MPNTNIPKDVFSHLIAIVTLYIGVVSIIALLFQYINVLFPDRLDFSYYYDPALEVIRRSSASLIVVWPVHILMSWIIGKDMRKDEKKRGSAIRRWLIYLTLFAAALTIIVDLITLLYNFLGGELTLRFALKVLSVLVVAGGVFGYYLFDIRREIEKHSMVPKQLAYAISVMMVVAIGGGFFIIGSPKELRAQKFDNERVQNLQSIQSEIINYWTQKEDLPATLEDLKDSISGFTQPYDPETNEPYKYEPLSPLSFNLCAVFKTSVTRYEPYQQNWSHGEGEVCFTRSIDPEKYSLNKMIYE